MPPSMCGILESSLYVGDVPRSVQFYEEIFGFRVISDFGERGCAMQAGAHQVLLLFKKGASVTIQSPHDGDGQLHVAFGKFPADGGPLWGKWLANIARLIARENWKERRSEKSDEAELAAIRENFDKATAPPELPF